MRKTFSGLFGLCLLLAQLAIPIGASAAPALTVSPASGLRGTAVGISASGLAPNTDHLVQFVRGGANTNATRLFEDIVRSNARGEIHYRYAVDQGQPGTYWLRIVALGGTVLATAPFTVTNGAGIPTITIAPDQGRCSTQPAISGDHFQPGSVVRFYQQRLGARGEALGTPRLVTQVQAGPTGGIAPFTVSTLAQDCSDSAPATPDGTRFAFIAVPPGSSIDASTEPERRAVFTIRRDPTAGRYFPETGFGVAGRFLAYWEAHGGLAVNGYPISDEFPQRLEDGKTYLVQYFERVRMEYHPENATPHDVLLGQFGRRALRAGDEFQTGLFTNPVAPEPGATFFPETGHNLRGRFLEYWLANGGLAQFGLPLTEAGEGYLKPDGPSYTVQYFERARFELHPENAAPYDVLLGQFGRGILADSELLGGNPDIERLYATNERLQGLVGRPTATATTAPGGFRAFERGAMIWRGDTREIYVLCGGDARTGDDVRGPFPDTWREGQVQGGGSGPRAGLYEPSRGFGKVWREQPGVRDCLGYATDPEETTGLVDVQPFRRSTFDNLLVATNTPGGRVAYALFRNYLGSSACIPNPALCRPDYERFPLARP